MLRSYGSLSVVEQRYPRAGCALLPRLLACLLDEDRRKERPPGYLRGIPRGLGPEVWEAFQPCEVQAIANSLALWCTGLIHPIDSRLAVLRPSDAGPLEQRVLRLGIRTTNALTRAGFLDAERGLHDVPLDLICAARSFGGSSLLDLLTSLEDPVERVHPLARNPARGVPVSRLDLAANPVPSARADAALGIERFDSVAVIIARFPRPGQALIPRVLAPLAVASSLPEALVRIGNLEAAGDLGPGTWEHLAPEQVSEIATWVAAELQHLTTTNDSVLSSIMLSDAGPLQNRVLALTQRTRNKLVRHGILDVRTGLQDCSLADLAAIPYFGGASLLDLLTSIQSENQSPVECLLAADAGALDDGALCVHQTGETAVPPGGADVELRYLVNLVQGPGRNRDLFLLRVGWVEGGSPLTLEDVSREFGITRERVRQVCRRIERKVAAAGEARGTPRLDDVLNYMASADWVSEVALVDEMLERGLLTGEMRLDALKHACRIMSKGWPVRRGAFGQPRPDPILETPVGIAVRECAMSAVAEHGVASVLAVAAILQVDFDQVGVEDVRKLTKRLRDYEDLGDDGEWFTLRGGRSRVEKASRKVLCVADGISVNRLFEAVRRGGDELSGPRPPESVLTEFLDGLDGISVRDGQVHSDIPSRLSDVLTGAELKLAEMLLEYGPVLTSKEIWQLGSDMGIGRVRLHSLLARSPVVTRLARSVYALVGSEVRAVQIAHIQDDIAKSNSKMLVDFAWSGDSQWWGLYRLTDSAIRLGRVTVPSTCRAALIGRYEAESGNAANPAELCVNNHGLGGLRPIMKALRVRAGDGLLVMLDDCAHTASIIGGSVEDLRSRRP